MRNCWLLLIFCGLMQTAPAQISGVDKSIVVELVSDELNGLPVVRDFCISADEKEAYFTVQSAAEDLSQIVLVKNANWKKPELLPFCDGYSYMEPFLSDDGLRLYFASNRPKSGSAKEKSDFDIWYVERPDRKSDWSAPVNMGSAVNSNGDEFYPSVATSKNLYFTLDSPAGLGKDDIYCSKWNGTAYEKPLLLDKSINSEGYEFNAFVSGDENLLIYTRYNVEGGLGSGDLYVARRNERGEWGRPENIGPPVNTPAMEYCPYYDSQTGTLYFTSRRSALKPASFRSFEAYRAYLLGGQNGMSKIYKCRLKL